MTISEKVAYIKGLAEGMKIDDSTNEGKITLQMLEVLSDIAITLEEHDDTFDDMAEIVSDIEESVYEIEDELFDDDDDYPDYDDFGDDLYEITCDKCGEVINVDYDALQGGMLVCPKCQKKLEFDLDKFSGDE
ncbi:MAG: hypothetical protein LBR74_09290 [Eubacterium sp.]|jgi:formylmethanofuran dehydrogenase subunit E|nr:hypothetical protein [Eubacterium sp.]